MELTNPCRRWSVSIIYFPYVIHLSTFEDQHPNVLSRAKTTYLNLKIYVPSEMWEIGTYYW